MLIRKGLVNKMSYLFSFGDYWKFRSCKLRFLDFFFYVIIIFLLENIEFDKVFKILLVFLSMVVYGFGFFILKDILYKI